MSDTEDIEVIQLDFGAGNVAPLPSRCLRVAHEPTDCDICAQACPVGALTPKPFLPEEDEPEGEEPKPKPSAKELLEKKLGVVVSEDCIHCGICTSVCPMEALSTTKHHLKGLEKQLKERVAKADGMALSCARSLFGVAPRLAERAISLPCLAALSTEEWFLAAEQAREAILPDEGMADEAVEPGVLKVYLPDLICEGCPVNICGDAEEAYLAAISQAEAWGADNIELINEAEGLRNTPGGTLMSALGDVAADDKRELVSQLANGLKRSWQSAGNDLTREKNRAEQLAKKRKQTKKTQQPNLNAPRPFGKKSQRRRLLRLALEQNADLVEGVDLLCAGTDTERCTGCGNCVEACPLNARRRVSSNSVLYFGKLPEDKRPKDTQAAITDELCCLGCSACVQVCPVDACTLTWLSGEDFLKLRQS